MKHYFLVAKDVGDLTAILCAGAGGARGEAGAGARPRDGALQAASAPRRARVRMTSSSTTTASTSRTPDVFRRDPVNLIRIFRLAQKHNLAFHPARDARRASRSLKLIDQKLRDDKVANGLFLEILTSRRRRGGAAAHERGRRARPLRARLRPHRRDDAVQHVPPLHGGRAPAALHRHPGRHRGGRQRRVRARQRADEDDPEVAPRVCSTSRCSCTTSPRAASRIIRSRARASRAASARGSGSRRPRPTRSRGWSSSIW